MEGEVRFTLSHHAAGYGTDASLHCQGTAEWGTCQFDKFLEFLAPRKPLPAPPLPEEVVPIKCCIPVLPRPPGRDPLA